MAMALGGLFDGIDMVISRNAAGGIVNNIADSTRINVDHAGWVFSHGQRANISSPR